MARRIDMSGRRRLAGVALALVLAGCGGGAAVNYGSLPASPVPATWNFDGDAAGGLPAGAEVFGGTWTVRAEPDAPSKPNALCQVGEAEFPALALGNAVYGDVTVTVRFKAISGKVDQAAGIIARVQDRDDYYIVRGNALEANVNLYKYSGGRRSGLKDGSGRVETGRWQELRLEISGQRLRGYLDGQLVDEASDATYAAGRVGLWTKADSVTCFDDVVVTPAAR
jgi:hypothetical protein